MIVRGKSTLRIRFYSLYLIAAVIFLISTNYNASLYSWTGSILVVFFLGYKATTSKCEVCGKDVQWTDEAGYVRQFKGSGTNFFGLINKCPYCGTERH